MIKITIVLALLGSFVFLQGFEEENKNKPNLSSPKKLKDEAIQKVSKKNQSFNTFDRLTWETDILKAFEKAKRENKNVMLMVEDTHCRWCINMKEGALSDAAVQTYLKKFILVKVQRSDKESIKGLKGFDGNIPSFFFMKTNKEVFENIVGYFTAEDFLGYMREIDEDDI